MVLTSMKSSSFALLLVALSLVFSPALAQKNCSKGKPCGNTCISMSYNCNTGSSSSGSSSDSSGSDYGDYSSGSGSDDDYSYTDPSTMSGGAFVPYDGLPGDTGMSGGASTLYDVSPEDAGMTIEELYTGLPTKQAYSLVKRLLDNGSFTEDINVVYAEDLIIQFRENSSGMAVLLMQGSNADLMDEITSAFY